MQPFIGRVPFLSGLTPTSLFGSLVPIAVGLILGHSRVGQHFVKALTAEYEGRLLTTDVECDHPKTTLLSSGRIGYSRGREVWRSQLDSSSIPKCIAASPATGQRQAQRQTN